MTLGNVLPIDAESARILARRNTRFRWFVAALTTTWLAALIPAIALSPLPPIGILAALVVLTVLAEHRFVLFSDETSMSASIIVIVASVVILSDARSAVGIAVVASSAGLYVQHLRQGAVVKVAVNASMMALAALGAYVAGAAFATTSGGAVNGLRIAIVLVSYWLINNIVVAIHQTTTKRTSLMSGICGLLFSDTATLVWAFLCAIAVSVAHNHPWLQLGFIATFLLAEIVYQQLDLSNSCSAFRQSALLPLTLWAIAVGILAATKAVTPWSVAMIATAATMSTWFHGSRYASLGSAPLVALVALSHECALVVLSVAGVSTLLRSADRRSAWTQAVLVGVSTADLVIYAITASTARVPAPIAVAVASFGTMAVAMFIYGTGLARALHRARNWSLVIGLMMASRRQFLGVAVCCFFGWIGLASMALTIAALTLMFGCRAFRIGLVSFRRTSEPASP